MSSAWLLVVLVAVTAIAIKGAGPTVLGGRSLPAPLQRVIALLAPTLLAALIATQIFTSGRHLALDARAAGLGVGAIAVWLRAPVLVAVVLAAVAASVTRAVG